MQPINKKINKIADPKVKDLYKQIKTTKDQKTKAFLLCEMAGLLAYNHYIKDGSKPYIDDTISKGIATINQLLNYYK